MSDTENQIEAARHLLRGRFHAILSTASARYEGHPFGSLTPYCLESRENPLLLLSHLSEHTRNLDADPRCAFTLMEEHEGDIQQAPRLTGQAAAYPLPAEEQPAAARRYFRYYPAARPYYEQLGFRFYRLEPLRFYFVGGFGAARWFGTDRILRPVDDSYEDAAQAVIQELEDETPWLTRLASALKHPAGKPAAIAGLDRDGIDIRLGDRLHRLWLDLPDPTRRAVMKAVSARLKLA